MKQILNLLSGIVLFIIAGCGIDKPLPGYIYVGEARSRLY